MDFYVVLCISLIILILFDVGESVFKNANIKKNWVLLFLVLSVILYFLPQISVGGIYVSLNYILYFLTFLFMIFCLKDIKQVVTISIVFCITLTLCVCYNSLNLLQFEFAYFQPYVLLAVVIGAICSTTTNNHNTIYCGVFLSVTISELIRSNGIMFVEQNKFSLGDSQFLCLVTISIFSFLLFFNVATIIKKIKQNRQKKQQINQQNA